MTNKEINELSSLLLCIDGCEDDEDDQDADGGEDQRRFGEDEQRQPLTHQEAAQDHQPTRDPPLATHAVRRHPSQAVLQRAACHASGSTLE